jgi:hypothetical protein
MATPVKTKIKNSFPSMKEKTKKAKFKGDGPKKTKKLKESSLNKNMSKSQFEKLYENVMQDENEALGLPSDDTGADDLGDGGFGGDETEDTVTVTLDKATAKVLIQALQAVVGEDESEDLGGEDEGFGDEGEGEDEGFGDISGSQDDAEEDKEEDEEEKVVTEAPQAGYEDFGVDAKSKVLQAKGKQKVEGLASKVAAAKGEGKQTAGTAHYMPLKKGYHNDIKPSANNLNPSGAGKSAFDRE